MPSAMAYPGHYDFLRRLASVKRFHKPRD